MTCKKKATTPTRSAEQIARMKAKFGKQRTEYWEQETDIEIAPKRFVSNAPTMMPTEVSGCRAYRENNPEYIPPASPTYNKPSSTAHSYATKRVRKSAWVRGASSSDQLAGRRYKQTKMDCRVVATFNVPRNDM